MGIRIGGGQLTDVQVSGLADNNRRPHRVRPPPPSEVRVSRTVKDLIAGSNLAFEDAEKHELKGCRTAGACAAVS